jgi:hypothetical protein
MKLWESLYHHPNYPRNIPRNISVTNQGAPSVIQCEVVFGAPLFKLDSPIQTLSSRQRPYPDTVSPT